MNDLISRQAAIDALWKALYEYEDKAEAYEDSLVKTCHEIIRKVKGALWNGK